MSNGTNGRGFSNPVDIELSKDGRIFVLNRCHANQSLNAIRIGICNINEEYLGEFGHGRFVLPTDMAFDGQDNLHVADEHTHKISVFNSSGKYLRTWGEYGNGNGQFNGPSGLVFNSKDYLYVVDQHNNRVQKFTGEGEYILQWGQEGNNYGEFNMPWGITVDSKDNVYVADWRNDRVQKFTHDGKYLLSIGSTGNGDGQFLRPSDITVDVNGYIYITDWGNERVQVLDAEGNFVLKIRGEGTVSKWAGEFLASNPDEMSAREKSKLIPNLSPEYSSSPYKISSQTEPYFWGPISVESDKEGRIYITESNRHRFQIYQKA